MILDLEIHNVPFGGFGTVMRGGLGGGKLGYHLRVGYLHRGRGGTHLRVGRHLGGDRVGTHRGGERVGGFLGGVRGGVHGGVLFGGLFGRLGTLTLSTDGSGNCFVTVDSVVEFLVTNDGFCVSISKKSALTSSGLRDSAVSMLYFHLAFAKVAFSQVITLVKIANAKPNVQNIFVY